jgi:thymidylate synthase
MYQRSADVALGVPFNIASYALLTHLVAKEVGVLAFEFIHVIGDAHIYEAHLDLIRDQVVRPPLQFPTVTIRDGVDIFSLVADDIVIHNYRCHPQIKMELVT